MKNSAFFGRVLGGALLTLFLVGCKEHHSELYPDLHSVPDRPTNTSPLSHATEEVSTMGQDQESKMEKNKALRDVFRLKTNTTKQG